MEGILGRGPHSCQRSRRQSLDRGRHGLSGSRFSLLLPVSPPAGIHSKRLTSIWFQYSFYVTFRFLLSSAVALIAAGPIVLMVRVFIVSREISPSPDPSLPSWMRTPLSGGFSLLSS